MRVKIAPVLVQVNMDDPHFRIEQINVLQVVIAGRLAEIGVPQVEAHAHVFEPRRAEVRQAPE